MTEKAAFLAQHRLFQCLQADEIDEIERITTTITCPPGRILYRPGEVGTALFFVRTGKIQLYHLSTDGRKLITSTMEAGACFGELPLLSGESYHCFAEAVEASCLYILNKHDLEQFLLRKPTATLALLQLVEQRFTRLEAQLVEASFKSTLARLANLLLQLAEPLAEEVGVLVVNGMSHEALAEHLGVYRETVSAALRDLRTAGAVELGRKRITIGSPARLKEIAAIEGKDRH